MNISELFQAALKAFAKSTFQVFYDSLFILYYFVPYLFTFLLICQTFNDCIESH